MRKKVAGGIVAAACAMGLIGPEGGAGAYTTTIN
jgi:hypothetical protein